MNKIIDEKIEYMKKVKVFTIETKQGEIKVEKYWIDDCMAEEYDSGYEIISGQDLIEKMFDDEQDELSEFISELV